MGRVFCQADRRSAGTRLRPGGHGGRPAFISGERVTSTFNHPRTFGELRNSRWAEAPLRGRRVRDEIRTNLLQCLEREEPLFPGIVGYDDTIVPQLVNALLARHHFILLGLRGQAKSRILRQLVELLDEYMPIVAGSE